MKVINLLNKIANGEKVPNNIIFQYGNHYVYYRFDYEVKNYVSIDDDAQFLIGEDITAMLNDEVEILEDKTYEIEEYHTKYSERCIDIEVREKLNEVIRAVNSILKKGDISE